MSKYKTNSFLSRSRFYFRYYNDVMMSSMHSMLPLFISMSLGKWGLFQFLNKKVDYLMDHGIESAQVHC